MDSSSKNKKLTKCWSITFLITNGINFVYGIFLLIIFSYFVAKNKFQDSFTISMIFLYCLYPLICVVGHLWTKKSLFVNYLYAFFLTLLYIIFLIFEWTIIIDINSFNDMIVGIFTNSKNSADLLCEILQGNIDSYKIVILVNTAFMVKV